MKKLIFTLAMAILVSGNGMFDGRAMAADAAKPAQTITRFGTLPAAKGPSTFSPVPPGFSRSLLPKEKSAPSPVRMSRSSPARARTGTTIPPGSIWS